MSCTHDPYRNADRRRRELRRWDSTLQHRALLQALGFFDEEDDDDSMAL